MAKQLLLNRGFENEFDCYITQGSVSTNNDIAYSGEKSAQLIATPTEIAEISQVVYFIPPLSPVKFSFCAKRFISQDVENVSNIRAEVNFISPLGTVIPPGIVIAIRGRDISKKAWNYYEGYAEVPLFSIAAQVIIRLEPPASGSSGLLIDDLALVAEVAMPAPPPAPASPEQQENPAVSGSPFVNPPFPGLPFTPSPTPVTPGQQQNPAVPEWPFANLPFPNLPFTPPPTSEIPFPGWPFSNMALHTTGAPGQENQDSSRSDDGNTPDTEKKE